MTITVSRTTITTRTITVPDHIYLYLPKRYALQGTQYRVTEITETLTHRSPKPVWGPDYEVIASGPVQTKSGKNHASQQGDNKYDTTNLPTALEEFLAGRGALLVGSLTELAEI